MVRSLVAFSVVLALLACEGNTKQADRTGGPSAPGVVKPTPTTAAADQPTPTKPAGPGDDTGIRVSADGWTYFCDNFKDPATTRFNCPYAVDSIAALVRFPELTELKIQSIKASDLAPIGGLHKLRVLSISNARSVTSIEPLRSLTQLEQLTFENSGVKDLSPLAAHTRLKRAWLSGNPVDSVAPLSGLTELEYVKLNGTNVSDLGPLRKLTKLKKLSVERAPITSLAGLEDMKQLELLRIFGTKVPKDEIERLKKALPKLTLYHDR